MKSHQAKSHKWYEIGEHEDLELAKIIELRITEMEKLLNDRFNS
jgi:hypothetical protein